jgi:SNF2 family DNA or RNA helicase
MPYIAKTCNACNKRVTVNEECTIDGVRWLTLTCGHQQIEEVTELTDLDAIVNFRSMDNKQLLPFQVGGVRFIEQSDFRCLVADEMRLGKTVQALAALWFHKTLWPIAVICKSSIKEQWAREILRWAHSFMVQVIEKSTDKILPKIDFYIFSFDILRRYGKPIKNNQFPRGSFFASEQPKEDEIDPELVAVFKKMQIKSIIIDECQQIKNRESQRAVELRTLIQKVGIKHILALSGTPIKNNATEYFSILNILRPEYFPTYNGYLYRWVDYYYDGLRYKYAGLRDVKGFQDFTKDFIIRREREEVLPDLPKVWRDFKFTDMEQEVAEAYNATLTEFQKYCNETTDSAFEKTGNILAYMNKMRHLTGLAKVDFALDFVTEFLTSCNRKIVLFTHHKDVALMLFHKLDELCKDGGFDSPIMLAAEISPHERQSVIDEFLNGTSRIAVASTLAYGEGVTLNKCADCVLVERQWNPANEEQCECRFIHIEQESEKITATYLVAVGTIDEFFSELVEKKRNWASVNGKEVQWEESEIMRELTEILLTVGKAKWRL